MRRFSLKAAALAGVLFTSALVPALAQQTGPGIVGDVNGDGRITSADALAVHAYLAGRPIPATFDVPGRGDADGDGRITRADAELIMRVAVGQAAPDRPVGKPAAPGTAPAEGPLRLQCFGDVRNSTVRCGDNTSGSALQAGGITYGGQHMYVSLLTTDVSTVADTLAFDLRVKNLIPQAIGTTDGTTVDTVRVFFASSPQAVGGAVTAVNHDGAHSFTTSEPQKFFGYPEIIQPQATSAARRWKLHVPAGVQTFSFYLYVNSPVVHPQGWVDVYPKTGDIPAGATLQLSDTVRSALGRPIPGAKATWASSNPAVATVDANGIVTAVADGTAQITGSSAPRSPGHMTLTVSTASLDSSRFSAAPATLPVRDTSTVTLQLRSATGTPITRSGGVVVLSADAGTLGAVTDNNNGTYTAKLTHAAVGTVKVGGTLNGAALRDTARVVFTAGAAAAYRVTASADTVPAGTQVAITAQTVDAYGNPVALAGMPVTWGSTGGGSFASASSATDSAGAATVAFTTATTAGVTHTVTATDSTSRTGTSGSIVTSTGAAAKLVFTQQPGNAGAGATIAPAVQVAIQDANGNVVTGAADSVAIAIGTNPAGGTLSGTAKVAAVNGVATFSGLSIDRAGTGYTLAASSGSLTGATSNPFDVAAGAASRLAVTTEPSDTAQNGAAFARQPVIRLQDALGNPVSQSGVAVTASIAAGGGTLGGTDTATTDASGVATFTNLSISGTVGDRTLSFSAGALTGATSHTVTVTTGVASSLVFSVQPSSTAAGASITPAVQVSVTDASGNLVTGYTDSVTVAIGTNPASGTLSGTARVAAVAGVATFANLSIDRTGTGYTLGASSGGLTGTSAAFNVTAGAASAATSTVVATPTSIVADGASTSTITVQLKDANGNNLTASGGTVVVGASAGSVGATTDNGDGTYTATLTSAAAVNSSVTVSATLGGTAIANTATVAFTPGAPAGYTVTRSNAAPVAGSTVTISAQLVDAHGHAVSASGRTVTWSSTSGGAFASPTSQTDGGGVATITFTTSTTAGTVHTVTATDGDGVTGTSGSITTAVGAAAKLAFTVQPSTTAAGASVAPAVQVAIQDANGNLVSGSSDGVTIAIGTNPASGTLSGTATVAAVNGVATFSSLSINKAGSGYTLAASSGSLAGSTSGAFDVTPGPAAALVFTVQPANVVASAAITPPVQVSIMDAFGNLATGATQNVTVAIGTNPSGGTLSGTATVAAANGVATFSDLSINLTGTGYTLGAASGSLTGATSAAFNVTHGPLHHFLVEAAGGGPIGAQLAGTPFNVRVTGQDEYNNTVTSFTGTVGFTSTPSGGISAGATSGAFTAGVLSSHAITFGTPGSFTLTAKNSAGAQSGTSNSFDVQAPPTAVNEGPASNSAPGQPFHAFYSTSGSPQTFTLAAPGVLSNDNLGFPAATITSFGADSLGGSVTTYGAGTTVSPLPGTGRTTGSLSVAANGAVTFTPPDGFTGNYVFRYRLTNARGTSDGQVTIAVGARPSAVNDTYSPQLVGNVPINTATSTQFRVTSNDSGDGKVLAITGQSNGTATLNPDSTFTFRPNAGFRNGTASFTYTVTNGFGTSAAATVTMTVANSAIWFVNAGAGSNGDGRYDSPKNCLVGTACFSDVTTDAVNDAIFLYSGNYTGGLTLLNGQKLIGQQAAASLSSIAGATWPADAGAEPAMNSASALDVTAAAGATAVTLNSANGSNLIRGLDFGNVGAAGTVLGGSNFGALTISEVGITTNGRALGLTNGTLSGSLAGLTSTGGATNVALTSVGTSGTFNFGSGALSGATTAALSIDGGSGSFAYAGTITNGSTAYAVLAQNRTGGALSLTGQITAVGSGISVTAGAGSTATVEMPNTANTIAAANGRTALNVTNTAFTANGLRFRSISANGSGTAANGIVLNNTGSLGSLAVAGNGGTCNSTAASCTGGTIESTTGAGVSLTSTVSPSFTRMKVLNTGGSGVDGTGVVGFAFNDGVIDNSGTALGTNVGNITFNKTTASNENNISGVVTINNNVLSNAYYHGIGFFNYSGTISNLTIDNNTITSSTSTANSKGDGIEIIARGAGSVVAKVTRASINNNRIYNFPSSVGIDFQCGGVGAPATECGTPGSATNRIGITANTIAGQSAAVRTGAEGMVVLVNASGVGNFNITGNNVSNTTGTSISHSAFGNVTVESVVSGNTIVSNNTFASQGIGIGTSTSTSGVYGEAPSLTTTITSNTISQTDGNGILVVNRDNSGTVRAKVQNNNVAAPLSGVRQGIRVDAGNSNGSATVCLNISGNTSAPTAASPGALGIGLRRQSTGTHVFGVNGMAATASPGVESYVDGLNPSGGGTLLISATSGFSNCSFP